MRGWARVVALVALAGTVGCTGGEPEDLRDSGPGPWGALTEPLGACHHGNTPKPPADLVAALTPPGAWYRVETLARGNGETKKVETKQYGGRYLLLGGDPVAVERVPRDAGYLTMPNTTAEAIDKAMAAGGTVTVRTGAGGDPRAVAYAFAEKHGQGFFVGECAFAEFTQPAYDRFQRAARYVSTAYGMTAAEMRALFALPVPQLEYFRQDPDHRALSPGNAPESLLDSLGKAWLHVELPASWRGDGTVCGVIDSGRSPCVRLDGTPYRAELYYDRADPRVDVVLHGAGPRPVARLATVDLAALAKRAGLDLTRDVVLLVVDLAASPSHADVVRDPSAGPRAVAGTRVVRCTVHRCVA